jgi:predicted PurR-regulated permease PerM
MHIKGEVGVTTKASSEAAREASFAQRALIASLIFVGVLAAAGLIWLTAHYMLIFFAGILLAILLDAISTGIGMVAPLPRTARIIIAALIVASAFAAIGFVIPGIIEQAPQFAKFIEQWVEWVRSSVANWGPVQETLENGQSEELMRFLPDPAGLLGGAAQIVGSALGILTGAVLIVVFGLYLAIQPERYFQGVLSAVSPDMRRKLKDTSEDAKFVLRRWLVGQIAMMMIIGVSSYIVLTLIGVPLALMLSFIAGLTAFIPYIGPLIGGGAMILVATTQDVSLGLIVIAFYLVLQTVESYLLTPMIQSRAIFISPALVILAQVVFGVLFGVLGIALATPLAAVIAVIVSRFYFHEPLEDSQSEA